MMIDLAILYKNWKQIAFIIVILLTVDSCKHDKRTSGEITDIKIDLKLARFEKDLFALKPVVTNEGLHKLRIDFGSFPDLYAKQVIGIPSESDSTMAIELTKYINDRYITEVYEASQKIFSEVDWIRKGLEEAFRYYNLYLPSGKVPMLLTFIAPFNYNILATDSTLGIGLDMYLGSDYKYYPSTGFPAYKIKKFSKEYIIADAMKAWLQSDYNVDQTKNDLLNNIIHEGKIVYATALFLPATPDSLIFGFSASQLEWCRNNEDKIWKFFIEQKLLFNRNPGEFAKFINDGASTSGFPPQAPAKIGCFIGWKIVSKYMEQKPEMKLEQLMKDNDGNKILLESKYKPERNG